MKKKKLSFLSFRVFPLVFFFSSLPFWCCFCLVASSAAAVFFLTFFKTKYVKEMKKRALGAWIRKRERESVERRRRSDGENKRAEGARNEKNPLPIFSVLPLL